jgi:hypothetical protein
LYFLSISLTTAAITLLQLVLSFSTETTNPLPHWHYVALICTENFSAVANQYYSRAQNLIHKCFAMRFHIQNWNSSHNCVYLGFQSGVAKDSILLGFDAQTASYPKQETWVTVANMLGPEVALSLLNLSTHLLTYKKFGKCFGV